MATQDFSFYFAGVMIGVARGPRDAVAVADFEGQGDRGFQADTMTLGNVNRARVPSRPQRPADRLAFGSIVGQRRPTSHEFRQRAMLANQDAFGTSNRRPVHQEPQMRSQAHAPRVRV